MGYGGGSSSPLPLPKVFTIMTQIDTYTSEFQELVGCLSTKQALILKKHPDIIARVSEISKTPEVHLIDELEREYNLILDHCSPTRDLWISTDDLDASIPEWFESSHMGWCVDASDFVKWARKFLMQEVSINLWVRYLEHKKKKKENPYMYGDEYVGYL